MALTIDTVDATSEDVWGRHLVRLVTVTFDDSYAASTGESLVPADVGLSEFSFVSVSEDAAALPGTIVKFDYTAQTLEVFGVEQDADAATTEPLDAEDDTEDLSTLVVRLLIVGH